MLRLMRNNYERGLYEEEEYQYWQKVNALKEKLTCSPIPELAIDRAARTLLNLHDSWDGGGPQAGQHAHRGADDCAQEREEHVARRQRDEKSRDDPVEDVHARILSLYETNGLDGSSTRNR